MSKKIDRRILRTRKILLEALMGLICERGYEAVSVKEITDKANVGRSTFYAHFENKEQLLFSGHNNLTLKLNKYAQSISAQDTFRLFEMLFHHVKSHRKLAKAMLGRGEDLMLQRVAEIAVIHFRTVAEQELVDEKRIELLLHAFSASILGLIYSFIEKESYEVDFMAEMGMQILNSFIQIAKKRGVE